MPLVDVRARDVSRVLDPLIDRSPNAPRNSGHANRNKVLALWKKFCKEAMLSRND
jgi:hypothetical protein